MKRALLIGTTIMSLVSLMASADEYRFIISGDPVAAATVDSSTAVSSGVSCRNWWSNTSRRDWIPRCLYGGIEVTLGVP